MQETKEKVFCYTAVMDSEGGFTAGIVVEGEQGYSKTDWHWKADYENAKNICEERNAKLGLDNKEVAVMVLKSMQKKAN